jgi:hypothetical protein
MIISNSRHSDGSGPYETYTWPDPVIVDKVAAQLAKHETEHLFPFCRDGETYVNVT